MIRIYGTGVISVTKDKGLNCLLPLETVVSAGQSRGHCQVAVRKLTLLSLTALSSLWGKKGLQTKSFPFISVFKDDSQCFGYILKF